MRFEHGVDQYGDDLFEVFVGELEQLLNSYGFSIGPCQDFAALATSEEEIEVVIGGCHTPNLWTIDFVTKPLSPKLLGDEVIDDEAERYLPFTEPMDPTKWPVIGVDYPDYSKETEAHIDTECSLIELRTSEEITLRTIKEDFDHYEKLYRASDMRSYMADNLHANICWLLDNLEKTDEQR